MRVTAVTCVKNEGPFLLEWIAFNRVIGVTDHLFYSNDCDDGTDALLNALAEAGICTHLRNPARGRNYQMEALKHAARNNKVRRADWVWIADVDEFLNIHVGDGTLTDLVAACENPQAISVNFQYFANGGVTEFEDRPVISQFTHTHFPDLFCGDWAVEVKTLIHRDVPLRFYGAHRPFLKGRPPEGFRWCDGSGRAVPPDFLKAARKERLRKFPARGARQFASLNHYALRSLDSYLVKHDRGDVNREHRAFDTSYWRDRNDSAHEDRSILKYMPRVEAELASLKALPKVADCHDASVRAHRGKIKALYARPEMQDLADTLRNAPALPEAEDALVKSLGPSILAYPEMVEEPNEDR